MTKAPAGDQTLNGGEEPATGSGGDGLQARSSGAASAAGSKELLTGGQAEASRAVAVLAERSDRAC